MVCNMNIKEMILKTENLSVSFGDDGAEKVLNEFSLEVYEKDKIAIIGETGSGKSIMLCAILRLLPSNANVEGKVDYGDIDLLHIDRESLNEIRGNEISYVPQGSANSMNPLLKVGYQVGEPLVIHGKCDKKSAWDKAIQLLKKFNIGNEAERAKQYPHSFSGGMRQRSLIAMGISTGARIILADEPTKGLDKKRITMVEEAFKVLEDKTLICVTHDLTFASEISTRLCIMYSSELVEEGPTEEVFSQPLHPYSADIINAMPENGFNYRGTESLHKDKPIGGCCYADKCIFKTEKCEKRPPLVEVGPSRKVRCWKYVKS